MYSRVEFNKVFVLLSNSNREDKALKLLPTFITQERHFAILSISGGEEKKIKWGRDGRSYQDHCWKVY